MSCLLDDVQGKWLLGVEWGHLWGGFFPVRISLQKGEMRAQTLLDPVHGAQGSKADYLGFWA